MGAPNPGSAAFTTQPTTQGAFKTALAQLVDGYLAGLLGIDGTAATARATLGITTLNEPYNPRGAWSSANLYNPGDYVSYSGLAYVCFSIVGPVATTPDVDTAHWFLAQGITAASLSASSGATLVGTILAMTGAAARTVAAKLSDTVSVIDFGADKTGAADSYAAFTAALTASKNVTVPAGTYSLSQPVIMPNGSSLLGSGSGNCFLQKFGSSVLQQILLTAPGFLTGSSVTQNLNIGIRGIQILVDGTSNYGLMVQGCTDSLFEDIKIKGAAAIANYWITGTLLQTTPTVKSSFANHNTFRKCTAIGAVIGFLQLQETSDTSRSIGNENLYDKCYSSGHSSKGFYNASGQGVTYLACEAVTTSLGAINFHIADSSTCLLNCTGDSSAYSGATAATPNIYGFAQGQFPGNNWAASTSYGVGSTVYSTGYYFTCTTGGTSASSGTGPGSALNPFASSITDGSVVWQSTAPSSSTYVTGFYFDTGSSGSSLYAFNGTGCYQIVTGISSAIMGAITAAGRNGSNVVPNLTALTQFMLSNGNWETTAWTPTSAGYAENWDSGAFNASGTITTKIQVQGQEVVRRTYSLSAFTFNDLIGCTALPSGSAAGIGFQTGASALGSGNTNSVAMYLNHGQTGSGNSQLNIINSAASGTAFFATFKYNGSAIGSISGSGSTTAFNTTSDYRLKVVLGDFNGADAMAMFDKVPVRLARWKDGPDSPRAMILAHEVQQVFPHAVTGEKDQMKQVLDEHKNPVEESPGKIKMEPDYQAVDFSKVASPEVIAALQYLHAEIKALRSKA